MIAAAVLECLGPAAVVAKALDRPSGCGRAVLECLGPAAVVAKALDRLRGCGREWGSIDSAAVVAERCVP